MAVLRETALAPAPPCALLAVPLLMPDRVMIWLGLFPGWGPGRELGPASAPVLICTTVTVKVRVTVSTPPWSVPP